MSFNPREFVDREPQLQAFRALLEARPGERILLFHGVTGAGKTWLIERLCAECRAAGIQFARVNFELADEDRPSRITDVIALWQSQIRDVQFSTQICDRLLALERELLPPDPLERLFSSLRTAPDLLRQRVPAATIRVETGDVRDSDITVAETILNLTAWVCPNPDEWQQQVREQKQIRLGQIVREALGELLARQPVVLLFDSCDAAPQDVSNWLRLQLLDPLLHGELAHHERLSFVIAGALPGECEGSSGRAAWVNTLAGAREGVVAVALGDLLHVDVRRFWVEIRGLSVQRFQNVFEGGGSLPLVMACMAQREAQREAAHGG